MPLHPLLRTQHAQYRDLVAGLELRATQTILPGFQWKLAALDFVEADPGKESRHIGEREHGIEAVELGLVYQRIHDQSPDPVRLMALGDCQGTHFAHRRRVEVKRPTSDELVAGIRDHE